VALETLVELVEYAIAFMVSMFLVGGSVAIYDNFTSYEAGLQLRGTFSAVAAVAENALENGSAKLAVPLPDSTIGCEGGIFYVSDASGTVSQSIPVGCDFQSRISAGTHQLSFSTSSGDLVMVVR